MVFLYFYKLEAAVKDKSVLLNFSGMKVLVSVLSAPHCYCAALGGHGLHILMGILYVVHQ